MFVVVLSFIAGLIGSITLVVFAEAVTQWYGNERFKAYSVIAIALALSALISVGVVVMQLWTAYRFVEVN